MMLNTVFKNREHSETPVTELVVAFEDAGVLDDKY
jgi:hypothetical protein